jgi:hypothetical protein
MLLSRTFRTRAKSARLNPTDSVRRTSCTRFNRIRTINSVPRIGALRMSKHSDSLMVPERVGAYPRAGEKAPGSREK